jgi:hypothetical protein
MCWNEGYCCFWILVNISHFFFCLETFFIYHIIINYPLLECQNWMHNCICARKWLSYIFNTSEAIHMRSWSGSLRKAGFTFHCFKFLPYYVFLRIIITQPSVCLTVVCYNNYIGFVHNPDFFIIIILHPVFQMLNMSSVRAVASVNISCAYCDCYFCDWIPIWQHSHWVCSNCSLVLRVDASDNQQNNVNYFNWTDVSYFKKFSLYIDMF